MNEDIYGLQASGIDPEIAAQMLGVKRRRDLALALQKQAMGPLSQTPTPSGGFAVRNHPLEAVAKIVQAYMANQDLIVADKEQAKLTSDNQRKVADALSMYEQKRMGTPAQEIPDAGPGDAVDTSTTQKAQPGNPGEAIRSALGNQLIAKNPLIMEDMRSQHEGPVIVPAGAVAFDKNTKKPIFQAGFKPERPKQPMTDFQIASVREMIAKGADMGLDVSGLQSELSAALAARDALKSAGLPVSAPTATTQSGQIPGEIVPPPQVIAAANSGRPFVATQKDGEPPVLRTAPTLPPASTRKIAEAKAISDIKTDAEQTDRVNKRSFAMTGLGDAISSARSLLTGVDPVTKLKIETPTGSGIGNIVDKAAGFFGVVPEGAKTADRLKVAGSAIVSKVPRFEGPQSDHDREYYLDMAGRIGDANIPIERRLAALKEVENIWTQFESGKKGGFVPNAASGQIKRTEKPEDGNQAKNVVRVVDF